MMRPKALRHTSVVVYGKEIYYGQGIFVVNPGTTHHGPPLEIVDLGTTELPEEVFFEYLEELQDSYTPEKYHLLDFNCNHFSNEVVGFLNGSQIPDHIQSLPSDFLATPFGQMLRPKIDSFFGASRSQNPVPLNSFGTVDPATLLATLYQPKEEILRPDRLESLQKLISTSKGLVVAVEKPGCTTTSGTVTLLWELVGAHGLRQVKLAIVTSTKPLPEYRFEDTQTIAVQFFAHGMEFGRTKNVCPNVLNFEFKNMLCFIFQTERDLNLKSMVAKLALMASKSLQLPQISVEKQAFLEVSRMGASELGDCWEEVDLGKFTAFDGGSLVSKLEPLLSLAGTLEANEASIILDGIAHLMRHPSLSASFAEYTNAPYVLGALVKVFEVNNAARGSILQFVCLGKLAMLAMTDPDLVTLGAKLAFNLSLNFPVSFSSYDAPDFFGLEDGEVWAMEMFSSVIHAAIGSNDPELGNDGLWCFSDIKVALLVETLVTAKMHLALTPSHAVITDLVQAFEFHLALETKLGSLNFSSPSLEFLKLSTSYLTYRL
ncbi:hypothetical protein L0F63_001760 [Massospora cicadina]|nr:hypothetical protein L0F63_001760 [Massospora cicadina]